MAPSCIKLRTTWGEPRRPITERHHVTSHRIGQSQGSKTGDATRNNQKPPDSTQECIYRVRPGLNKRGKPGWSPGQSSLFKTRDTTRNHQTAHRSVYRVRPGLKIRRKKITSKRYTPSTTVPLAIFSVGQP